jgi:hypothetical protein
MTAALARRPATPAGLSHAADHRLPAKNAVRAMPPVTEQGCEDGAMVDKAVHFGNRQFAKNAVPPQAQILNIPGSLPEERRRAADSSKGY